MRAGPAAIGACARFFAGCAAADEIAHLITLICRGDILLITSLLVYQLWVISQLARAKFGWMFFWTETWDPVSGDFGALPFIYGTLVTSAVALCYRGSARVWARRFFWPSLRPRKTSSTSSLS